MIELLVVIAIIAVLAALLFAGAKQVRMKGYETESASNLRQWGAAMAASLQDFGNRLPSDGDDGSSVVTEESAWFNRLPPYMGHQPLKNLDPGSFPKVGDKSVWVNRAATTTSAAKPLFFYGINYFFSGPLTQEIHFLQIERPSATVWMCEGGVSRAIVSPGLARSYFPTGAGSTTDPDNTANFLFCDGHVAPVPRKQFSGPAATAGRKGNSGQIDTTFTWVPYPGASSS